MIISLYDVAYEYILKNYSSGINKQDKVNTLSCLKIILNDGATSQEILSYIDKNKDNEKNPKLFFNFKFSKNNLLKTDCFYNHNELRKTSPPPTKTWDIDTGEITSYVCDYFLEMRASYTFEDLIKYIQKKESLCDTVKDKNRAIGSLKFLFNKYGIDFLLFLIDTVNDIYVSKKVKAKSLIELNDYVDESVVNYNRKVSESKISGQDIIVFKKRAVDNV